MAFYVLVRFVADIERQEAINVGVLAARDTDVHFRFVVDRLEDASVDVVRRFEGLLRHIVQEEQQRAGNELDGVALLAQLSFRRFSHFDITEPRQIICSSGVDALVDELSQRMAAAPRDARELAGV